MKVNAMAKIDTILLCPHHVGHNSMWQYFKYVPDMSHILVLYSHKSAAILPDILSKVEAKHIAITVDRPCDTLDQSIILDNTVKKYSLLVIARDPLEHLVSVLNAHSRWWAMTACFMPYNEKTIQLINMNSHSVLYQLHERILRVIHKMNGSYNCLPELLPCFAPYAGEILVLDTTDLKPGDTVLKTMGRVSNFICKHDVEWQGNERIAKLTSGGMYADFFNFRFAPNLKFKDHRISFSAIPKSKNRMDLLKENPENTLFYGCEEIEWNIDGVSDPFGFSFPDQNIDASGMSRDDFMALAKSVLEDNDKYLLKEYGRRFSHVYRQAQRLADALKVTREMVIQVIQHNDKVGDAMKKFIYDTAQELAAVGSDVPDRWSCWDDLGMKRERSTEEKLSHMRAVLTKHLDENMRLADENNKLNAELEQFRIFKIKEKAAQLQGKEVFFYGAGAAYEYYKSFFSGVRPRGMLLDAWYANSFPGTECLPVLNPDVLSDADKEIPVIVFCRSEYLNDMMERVSVTFSSAADIFPCVLRRGAP
ncbi:hypothetical protein FACS1894205_1330 [Alphaproteobacteria bacterium]|nr:hypothetical protein FACS1894205_1330 [Alphaproteobacteria bacterium]